MAMNISGERPDEKSVEEMLFDQTVGYNPEPVKMDDLLYAELHSLLWDEKLILAHDSVKKRVFGIGLYESFKRTSGSGQELEGFDSSAKKAGEITGMINRSIDTFLADFMQKEGKEIEDEMERQKTLEAEAKKLPDGQHYATVSQTFSDHCYAIPADGGKRFYVELDGPMGLKSGNLIVVEERNRKAQKTDNKQRIVQFLRKCE